MIRIEHTPKHAGARISGDFYDFEDLYDALHQIARDEEELEGYGGSRLRILSTCYEMRQALMGNRGTREVPNGSGTNLYYTVDVLWPEMLFISFVLNDFIGHYDALHDWDPDVAAVRKFQSAVARCLADTLPPARFRDLKKYINPHGMFAKNKYQSYLVQYVDSLNIEHLRLPPHKRLSHISAAAKCTGELDHFYYAFRSEFLDASEETGVHVSQLRYGEEYPDEIEW